MLDQVAAAFDRQDYKTAAQLLKPLVQQSPQNPWVQFYVGRLQEVNGKPEAAESTYRRLLQETTNPKLALQARQGLQRLEDQVKEKRQEAIAKATEDPSNTGVGFLVLEPIDREAKQSAAQKFARIMKLDPYTARLHLPSRGWRLYRTGAIAEVQVYSEELQEAGIPAFWVPLEEVKKIRVFQVHYFEAIEPNPVVICQNEADQLGSLEFNWSEVSARVEGLLPIFEDVIDLGAWNKLKHKEQTRDYAQIFDLHLPGRNCILRFCDSNYQFQQGVNFSPSSDDGSNLKATTRQNWNSLLSYLNLRLPNIPVASDFTPFAETALEHLDMVNDLKPHIDLFRKEETNWDPAFQLYSGMRFLKEKNF